MTIVDKAVPNVVGVDIGCGMYTVNLGKIDIDFESLMRPVILFRLEKMFGMVVRSDLT